MTLKNGFPGHSALATFVDLRRDLEGAVVRDAAGKMRAGVFAAHYDPLVAGRSDMKVDVAEFRAVQDRGGAIFLANDGVIQVTLAAAPAANRRIDLIYVTQQSTDLGDTASTPIFGVVQGVASPTPTVPALPANVSDAIRFATVEIPAGATTTLSSGVIITPVYLYTAMAGGIVPVRNSVELAAWQPADGAHAYCIADTRDYVRVSGTWEQVGDSLLAAGTITAQSTFSIDGLVGYERYEVTLILTASSAAQGVGARLRAGGSDDSGANYDIVSSASNQLAQSSWQNMVGSGRTEKSVRLLLLNLNRVEKTYAESTVTAWDATANPSLYQAGLRHRSTSAFDGVTFITTGGTVTGRYEVRAL